MKIFVLPGDGIGPEITAATLAVLVAADRRFSLACSSNSATSASARSKARHDAPR